MVSLSVARSSNSRIYNLFPRGLVAIFVGGTSGIGEAAFKNFATYIVGRSQDAADRIITECKTLNPSGSYIFIKADISLIRGVDEVCQVINEKEKSVNILFLSQGVRSFDRSKTSEGLHLLAALNYYTRLRFITNLLPLLRAATFLRRVISVGGGTLEDSLDTTDFPALHVPFPALRGHLSTLITLGLEAVAKTAPEVSFVHDYPGTVKTQLLKNMSQEEMSRIVFTMPIEESGDRQLYLATSARFPAFEGGCDGVQLGESDEVAVGTNGAKGSGMYSVGSDCESASTETREFLAELRDTGMVNEVWQHTEGEYQRITGNDKI